MKHLLMLLITLVIMLVTAREMWQAGYLERQRMANVARELNGKPIMVQQGK